MKDTFNDRGYVVVAVVLVGIGAFFLGGLFVYSLYRTSDAGATVRLTPLDFEVSVYTSRVYASSRGRRYYPWWCDAGREIAEKNVVWYETPVLAEVAGYSIAKGCS